MAFSEFGVERGTPIRMPSSSILGISSADRYANIAAERAGTSTPFDFSIQKQENMMAGSITRMALTEFVLPWFIPNINENTRKIYFWYSSTDPAHTVTLNYQLLTIPVGFYTGQELANVIYDTINATSASDLVTWFNNSAFKIQYIPSQGSFIASTTLSPTYYRFQFVPYIDPAQPNKKNLFDIMNWSWNGVNPTTGTMSNIQYSGIAPMVATDYIDVICDQITYNQELNDSTSQKKVRNMLARIYLRSEQTANLVTPLTYNVPLTSYATNIPTAIYPLTPAPTSASSIIFPNILGTRPFTIYRQFQTPKYVKWSGNGNIPGYMRFQLLDDQGNIITSGATGVSAYLDGLMPDWNMTLLASET